MMRNKLRTKNILHVLVIAYMLLALVWWSLLLYNKNLENYELKLQLSPDKSEVLAEKFGRQKIMIVGEALMFGLAMVTGIWLINRAYIKEVSTSEKQSNFLLSITHELKSPLASIRLILQTFLKHKLTQDKIEKLSSNAISEADRLESMVGNILLATKIDHSYNYNFEAHSISALLKERLSIFRTKYPNRPFTELIEEGLKANIDRESFISIVVNLIENAHKYAPAESEITVQLNSEQSYYVLQVSDFGKGVNPSEVSRIFEKFYRAEDEEVRSSKGSGLGLYIVKKIVDDYRGEISYQNNKPSGARFVISLPILPNIH